MGEFVLNNYTEVKAVTTAALIDSGRDQRPRLRAVVATTCQDRLRTKRVCRSSAISLQPRKAEASRLNRRSRHL
jgi:hypothetical protein